MVKFEWESADNLRSDEDVFAELQESSKSLTDILRDLAKAAPVQPDPERVQHEPRKGEDDA